MTFLGGRPGGRPPSRLKIGEIVHLTDRTNCIPFLIDIVNDPVKGIIGGKGSVHPSWIPGVGIEHDPRPDAPPKITIVGAGPMPTWHYREQCPWDK